MQTVFSRIWTPDSDSISYDENRHAKCISLDFFGSMKSINNEINKGNSEHK